jgi:hypothetical protein
MYIDNYLIIDSLKIYKNMKFSKSIIKSTYFMAKNNLQRGAIVEALKKVTDDIREIPNDAVCFIIDPNLIFSPNIYPVH